MCIACKVYGRQKIKDDKEAKKALQFIKDLYVGADEEMLLHLDALTNRWLLGKSLSQTARNLGLDEEWERSHR